SVLWQGPQPPAAILAALRRANISLAREAMDDVDTPLVISTSTRRVPTVAKPGRRWIWLCAEDAGDAGSIEATLRGAYAVISLKSPTAAADLAARLQELLTPEAAQAPPAEIVMVSDASRRAVAHAARVAPTSMPVLLTGETGTGKEVLARLIHA